MMGTRHVGSQSHEFAVSGRYKVWSYQYLDSI